MYAYELSLITDVVTEKFTVCGTNEKHSEEKRKLENVLTTVSALESF